MENKRIACVFTTAPYRGVVSQEGLDIVLSLSVLSDRIGIFFISDGIFFPLCTRIFEQSLVKDFISSFELLLLCGVQVMYLCSDSAFDRGVMSCSVGEERVNLILKKVVWVSSQDWRKKLSYYDLVFNF